VAEKLKSRYAIVPFDKLSMLLLRFVRGFLLRSNALGNPVQAFDLGVTTGIFGMGVPIAVSQNDLDRLIVRSRPLPIRESNVDRLDNHRNPRLPMLCIPSILLVNWFGLEHNQCLAGVLFCDPIKRN